MAPTTDTSKRNIVFFGETGMGKSSTINLLLEPGASASVSNNSQPCTQVSTKYETTIDGIKCILWDTRGLGEGRGWFEYMFGGGAEDQLKKLLKERYRNHEIDLLVYCVRGSRVTKASMKYYNDFCAVTRRIAAPVAILVTGLEEEGDMEGWWTRNASGYQERGMEFDDHACITTLPDHPQRAECKKKLADLVTREHDWRAQNVGPYFGFTRIAATRPRRGKFWSRFRGSTEGKVNDGGLSARFNNFSSPSSPISSTKSSSYHTPDSRSATESTPPSPVVEPPTPQSATTVPRIHTDSLEVGDLPQPSSGETSSTKSSLLHASSGSSHTSHSELYLESGPEESKDYPFSELPFKYSTAQATATIRRRRSYATQSGAFGDVWECDLISGKSSRVVAVKAIKTNANDNDDLRSHDKKLRRELKVWGRLRHKNIVPLLGVVSGFGPLPSTVSPWFRNGSLSHYLAHHQLPLSKKHRLLWDIAVGLCYLHSQDVTHGDLHSGNVLIDDNGSACLTDFGLSFISDFVGTSYLKSGICGGMHFADPALVERACKSGDNVFYPTKPCDIYSFGGLMLHVLSGKKPYDGIPQHTIFMTVLNGERPQIPTNDRHITPSHKIVIQMCWDPEERKRPSADSLVRKFDRQ